VTADDRGHAHDPVRVVELRAPRSNGQATTRSRRRHWPSESRSRSPTRSRSGTRASRRRSLGRCSRPASGPSS